MGSLKKYISKDIEISWDSNVCIHAAVCINKLPGVFNLEQKPWIDPTGGSVNEIKELIHQCPSGALAYNINNEDTNDEKEATEQSTEVALVKNGPLRLKGDFQIFDENGARLEHKSVVSLCRCGASKNKPYCDGTHKSIDFEA